MAEKEKKPFGGLKMAAQKSLASIDMEALKEKAAEATGILKEKAIEVKDAAVAAKDEITDKLKVPGSIRRQFQDGYLQSISRYASATTMTAMRKGKKPRWFLPHFCYLSE